MNPIVPTENQEAKTFMDWCFLAPIVKDLIIHIPNEGKRSYQNGKFLKSIGLRGGVSDFFLPYPNRGFHGLWIELKRKEKSAISMMQKVWIEKMLNLNYAAHIAYGAEQAINIVKGYMNDSFK